MSLYAFISKNVGGIRIGIGKRLSGGAGKVCKTAWCKYRMPVLAFGSAIVIGLTTLAQQAPRATLGLIVFGVVLAIGWLFTCESTPAESAPEAATPAASTPTRAEERLAAIMHPKD